MRLKSILRPLKWVIAAMLAVNLAFALFIAAPGWAFAYEAGSERLRVHATEPLPPETQAWSEAVMAQLDASILPPNPEDVFHLYVARGGWREWVVFLPVRGAGGVMYPFNSRAAFLSGADIPNDRLLKGDWVIQPPRTLGYYAEHEINHLILLRQIGHLDFYTMPAWIREGVADYSVLGPTDAVVAAAIAEAKVSGERLPLMQAHGAYPEARHRVTQALKTRTLDELLGEGHMSEKTGTWIEWIVPFVFVLSAGWFVWHLPAFILDFLPSDNESLFSQTVAIHEDKDVTPNMPGLFGGFADPIDWLSLIAMPILTIIGMRTFKVAQMEHQDWRSYDRFAIFIGRVTMLLILSMTGVMLYEVFLRYAIEAPTLWANELTLWIGGFVFLSSGLYAMQQRSHIRIFIVYDLLPRNLQRLCDVIWTTLLVAFVIGLIFGSYQQVFGVKFYRWETFGTAFDPPIPSTIQPFILIILPLIAIQAVLNLISDWNAEPVIHTAADDIDAEELEALKKAVGKDGVGDTDVTRSSIQRGEN